MDALSKEFWTERYVLGQTGWDLGVVSPPLKAYFDQLDRKDLRILIPGCGNGYEAEYLFHAGFTDVHVVDLSELPLKALKARCPDFPDNHLHVGDFFAHEGVYDLIVEQTMFCAIDPSLRQDYANQVNKLLRPTGKLVGLLFSREFDGGPPFGGNREEYAGYFSAFSDVRMDPCYNSIEPRQGSELFVRIGN